MRRWDNRWLVLARVGKVSLVSSPDGVDGYGMCFDCQLRRPIACFVCDACAEHCCMRDPDACWEASEAFRSAYKGSWSKDERGQWVCRPIGSAPKPPAWNR